MSIPADFVQCQECGQPMHRMYVGSAGICIHCEEPKSPAAHFSAGDYGEGNGERSSRPGGQGFQYGNSGYPGNKKNGHKHARHR